MSTDEFKWPVLNTATGGGDFAVIEAKFGDGYSQRAVNGLNNESQKWSVTVVGTRDEIFGGPLAFIRSRKGMSFTWTPPITGVQGLFTCKGYKPQDQGGQIWTLGMDFEQVFSP